MKNKSRRRIRHTKNKIKVNRISDIIRRPRKGVLVLFIAVLVLSLTSLTILSERKANADPINNTDFVTTWRITDPGSTSITIPTTGGGYNYSVDWDNDGEVDESGITGNVTHDFGEVGDFTIRISGAFPRIYNQGNASNAAKLIDINQWGMNHWLNMSGAFYGTSLTTISATDMPDLSGVSDMSNMFYSATNFNGDASAWDTSNVTNMAQLFGDTKFNQDISGWNTSNVTNMSLMFVNTPFNQDISGWSTSKVANFSGMFRGTTAFNQDISGWNTSSATNLSSMFYNAKLFNQDISGWNTSIVTNMNSMFLGATAFNQDISGWNTSNVTNMSNMFNGATSFNQNISTWNTSKVTTMAMMFISATSFDQDLSGLDITSVTSMSAMFNYSGLSISNYDATLTGWAVQNVKNAVNIGVINLKYCAAKGARSSLINNHSWNFTGDSECPLPGAPTNLSPTPIAHGIELQWTALNNETVTDYLIEYSINNGTDWNTYVHDPSLITTATFEHLYHPIEYLFRVSAINARGTGTPSDTVQASPIVTPTVVKIGDDTTLTGDGPRAAIPKQPIFSGTTVPFSDISVTVYSDPVMCETASDASGDWSCTLPSSLPSGDHTVYATITFPDESTMELGPYEVLVEADTPPQQNQDAEENENENDDQEKMTPKETITNLISNISNTFDRWLSNGTIEEEENTPTESMGDSENRSEDELIDETTAEEQVAQEEQSDATPLFFRIIVGGVIASLGLGYIAFRKLTS